MLLFLIKMIKNVVDSDDKHLILHPHAQVCWLIQFLKNLAKDGATPSLLLKTQSPPCRSRRVWLTLAGSAPGEKLVAIYTCCRYGPDWAQWRKLNGLTPKAGNEATLDLGLDANRKITSVTGISNNSIGDTYMLQAQHPDGSTWGPHGPTQLYDDCSERPSPSSIPMILSHLSGDTTDNAYILRFHWRPQWAGGSALHGFFFLVIKSLLIKIQNYLH